METKGKQGEPRVPGAAKQYVTYNFARLSGARTGNDRNYLKSNDGRLSKVQGL